MKKKSVKRQNSCLQDQQINLGVEPKGVQKSSKINQRLIYSEYPTTLKKDKQTYTILFTKLFSRFL